MLFSRFSRWLDQNFSFTKLVEIYRRKTHSKKLWWLLKKWGRYLTFWTLEKKEKKEKEKRNIEVSKIFNFGNLKIQQNATMQKRGILILSQSTLLILNYTLWKSLEITTLGKWSKNYFKFLRLLMKGLRRLNYAKPQNVSTEAKIIAE